MPEPKKQRRKPHSRRRDRYRLDDLGFFVATEPIYTRLIALHGGRPKLQRVSFRKDAPVWRWQETRAVIDPAIEIMHRHPDGLQDEGNPSQRLAITAASVLLRLEGSTPTVPREPYEERMALEAKVAQRFYDLTKGGQPTDKLYVRPHRSMTPLRETALYMMDTLNLECPPNTRTVNNLRKTVELRRKLARIVAPMLTDESGNVEDRAMRRAVAHRLLLDVGRKGQTALWLPTEDAAAFLSRLLPGFKPDLKPDRRRRPKD